jgi:uncharacterized membrane protein YgcG
VERSFLTEARLATHLLSGAVDAETGERALCMGFGFCGQLDARIACGAGCFAACMLRAFNAGTLAAFRAPMLETPLRYAGCIKCTADGSEPGCDPLDADDFSAANAVSGGGGGGGGGGDGGRGGGGGGGGTEGGGGSG